MIISSSSYFTQARFIKKTVRDIAARITCLNTLSENIIRGDKR